MNDPTPSRAGKNRAEKVSGARRDITRLFEVIGKCMGYIDKAPPTREVLLEEGMKFMVSLWVFRFADSFGDSNPSLTFNGSCKGDSTTKRDRDAAPRPPGGWRTECRETAGWPGGSTRCLIRCRPVGFYLISARVIFPSTFHSFLSSLLCS